MNAVVLDGKNLALKIRQELKNEILAFNTKPSLSIILVGNNESSKTYVRNKLKVAEEIGIKAELHSFDESLPQTELIALIQKLNHDPKVNGIMVQLPLPKSIDAKAVLSSIDPIKDVDGFHPYNIGLLQNGYSETIVAATPKGIIRILEETKTDFTGKHALIIGRSQIVGKPIAMLLLNKNCTITVAHSKTKNLDNLINQADIIVAACGCPKLVKGENIKPNAIIIDVGINYVDGKLCGDVDFESAVEKASYITPVPGGVGPMTIAMLLENTLVAYKKQNNL